MKPLIQRHQDIFDFISKHVADHGTRPSYKEIANTLGFKSTNTVWVAVERMERRGLRIPGEKPRHESDPDIFALAVCVKALNGCTEDGRRANIAYLNSRFQDRQAETMGK